MIAESHCREDLIKPFSSARYCAMMYKVVFDTTYNSNG